MELNKESLKKYILKNGKPVISGAVKKINTVVYLFDNSSGNTLCGYPYIVNKII